LSLALAPLEVSRNAVFIPPRALFALEADLIPICGDLGGWGLEAMTFWALDRTWGIISHWSCAWMGPFECCDNHRFKYDDICVSPKNLLLTKNDSHIDAVIYEVIESEGHCEVVCEGRLEIRLGEAQNFVKKVSEKKYLRFRFYIRSQKHAL